MNFHDLDQKIAQFSESVQRWRSHAPRRAIDPPEADDDFERRALDLFYPPEDMSSTRERAFHLDLKKMSDPRLANERARLRLRLMLAPEADSWLVDRLDAINKELARRG